MPACRDEEERVRATEFYVKIQIVGTPEDCIQQIAELQRVTGTDHVVTEFSFGGIPHDDAEKNMRLFASRVLPVLQNDALSPHRPRRRWRRLPGRRQKPTSSLRRRTLYSRNCAARHLTAAGTPSRATISRNF